MSGAKDSLAGSLRVCPITTRCTADGSVPVELRAPSITMVPSSSAETSDNSPPDFAIAPLPTRPLAKGRALSSDDDDILAHACPLRRGYMSIASVNAVDAITMTVDTAPAQSIGPAASTNSLTSVLDPINTNTGTIRTLPRFSNSVAICAGTSVVARIEASMKPGRKRGMFAFLLHLSVDVASLFPANSEAAGEMTSNSKHSCEFSSGG